VSGCRGLRRNWSGRLTPHGCRGNGVFSRFRIRGKVALWGRWDARSDRSDYANAQTGQRPSLSAFSGRYSGSMPSPPYECHPQHRNLAPEKSQWTISEAAEEECFSNAWINQWVDGDHAWGLHLGSDSPLAQNLGLSHDQTRSLWFAKFCGGSSWHGYPADLGRRGRYDAPPGAVAREWRDRGHIRRATLNKLARGVECTP
jgi:hypothetical protein